MSNESIVAWMFLMLGAILVGYLLFKAVLNEKEQARKEAEDFWFKYDQKFKK